MSYKFKTGSMSVKTEDGFKDIGILVGASGGVDSTELATIKQEQGEIKESLSHLEDGQSALKEDLNSLKETGIPSSDIEKAVSDYLTKHPASGLNEAQVNSLIDSKLGVIENGTY